MPIKTVLLLIAALYAFAMLATFGPPAVEALQSAALAGL